MRVRDVVRIMKYASAERAARRVGRCSHYYYQLSLASPPLYPHQPRRAHRNTLCYLSLRSEHNRMKPTVAEDDYEDAEEENKLINEVGSVGSIPTRGCSTILN